MTKQIRIEDTKELMCKCGSTIYEQVFFIRIVPALLSGSIKPEMLPIQVFRCINCEKIAEIDPKKSIKLQ